jgi:hypothetical protein
VGHVHPNIKVDKDERERRELVELEKKVGRWRRQFSVLKGLKIKCSVKAAPGQRCVFRPNSYSATVYHWKKCIGADPDEFVVHQLIHLAIQVVDLAKKAGERNGTRVGQDAEESLVWDLCALTVLRTKKSEGPAALEICEGINCRSSKQHACIRCTGGFCASCFDDKSKHKCAETR